MAILGLDAINRFFDSLYAYWVGYWNVFGVLGMALFFVFAQFLTVWFYIKIMNALINFEPKVRLFINRVMLFFD
jgi:hypothetical protein